MVISNIEIFNFFVLMISKHLMWKKIIEIWIDDTETFHMYVTLHTQLFADIQEHFFYSYKQDKGIYTSGFEISSSKFAT